MTPAEAFKMALELAISAPTEEKAEKATRMAEELAVMLTPQEVEAIKTKLEGVAA